METKITLRKFIKNHKRLDLRELRGKVKIREDYDYKKLRIMKESIKPTRSMK